MNLIINSESPNIIYTDLLHFRDLLKKIAENNNSEIISQSEYEQNKANLSSFVQRKYNKKLQNLILFGHLTILLNLVKTDFKIIAIIDDLHHQGPLKKNRQKVFPKIDKILSSYGYCFNKYFNIENYELFFFPHTSRYLCGFNNNPIENVLISGRFTREIYPKRFLAHKYSETHSNIQYLKVNFKYRLKNNNTNNLKYGQDFINTLNKYLVCFTCDASENRPYILAKHFEILASGSLLLSANGNTKEYFERLGFIDNEHYISCDESNMLEKIRYCLDKKNREKINKIRLNGYNLFKQEHSFEKRLITFEKILENNYENKKQYVDGIAGTKYYYL